MKKYTYTPKNYIYTCTNTLFFKEISMRIQPDSRNFSHWHCFHMFFPCTELHRTHHPHHPNPRHQGRRPWWHFKRDQLTNQGVWSRSFPLFDDWAKTSPKIRPVPKCIHERYLDTSGQAMVVKLKKWIGYQLAGQVEVSINNINEIFGQTTIKCQTDVQEFLWKK